MNTLTTLACVFIILGTAQAPLQAQCHSEKVFPEDPDDNDVFGSSVAVDATRMVVGASGDDENGQTAGAIYVFEGSPWTQTAKLTPAPGSHLVGHRVAVDGDTLLASDDRDNVYVFEYMGGSWQANGVLTNPDGPDTQFGEGIDVDDEWIAVGAPLYDDGPDENAGAVYLFRNIAGTWSFFQRLTWSSFAGHTRMGTSIDIDGTELLVGTPRSDSCIGFGSGTVLAYQFDGLTWTLTQEIYSPDPCETQWFGWSLDRHENELVVSAPFTPSTIPRTFVFELVSGSWLHADTLVGPTASYHFAGNVSIEDNLLAVGLVAFRKLDQEWRYAGTSRAFDRPGGTFEGSLGPVSVSNQMLFIGAEEDSDMGQRTGAVYVLEAPTNWTWGYCMDQPCPCANEVHWSGGGCSNSTGSGDRGSILDACGSPSVLADDMVLTADFLPTNKPGIFFMGGSKTQSPFGDGLRCVGAGGIGLFRFLPPVNSGSAGQASLGPGIVARSQNFGGAGAIDPGETWNFQFWYRDPMGPCGTAFNLSSARAITFQP